jgi:hypothetical protein
VQEEKAGHQEERQGGSEENGPVREVEKSSATGELAATDEEEQAEEGEEEPVEEAEEEDLAEGELIQRRGCLRGCLTPIAAILMALLVMVMIVYAKRSAISEWLRQRIVANTQNHVLSDLPEDMDEKEIEASFEKVKTALKEGRIDEEALDEIIKEYWDVVQKLPVEERQQAINTLMVGLNAAIIGSNE